MDAVLDLAQAVARAARDGVEAERDPLRQDLAQALLPRAPVGADHDQVDRRAGFQAGMRQQRMDELLLADVLALGLEHQPHRRILAGFIAHRIQHCQYGGLELLLVLRQRLLAGLDLGVGDFLDLFQHLLRRGARWQLGHHQLPLAARHLLDGPARAHLQAAAAALVDLGDIGRRRDDLAAARIVRARHQRQQLGQRDIGIADHRHGGRGDFAQVVRRDLGRHAHRDARGAVEQDERQPRRQQPGLLHRAVVVRDEVDRALVDLVEQQPRDRRQPRFGVAHRRRAVAVARAEVALAVDQRVAQREVLRQAHQRVIGGLVAMRVELAQHIADHARGLDRLGVGAQAHLMHREQDAPLHRLLAVGHLGQRAALDHADGVVKVGALGVARQRQRIGRLFRLKRDVLLFHG
ncbi:hypothetical protein D9M72_432590 [compost metagenome]